MTTSDPTGQLSLELLEELCALSRDERARIAKLDARGLVALAETKQARLDRLRALSLDPRDGRLAPDTRRKLRVAARRLDVESHTNEALLREAIGALGHAMGALSPATTYDARARLRSSVAPLARTNL